MKNSLGYHLISILFFSCVSAPLGVAADQSGSKAAEWRVKMKELEVTLQSLIADVTSDEKFSSPQNFKRIQKSAESLAKLAHDLNGKKVKALDHDDGSGRDVADPSLKIIASLFADEASRAQKMLVYGNRSYARDLLRAMPGYCIACHSRNSAGPQFSSGWADPGPSSKTGQGMSTLEKANFLAATRRFDQALDQYGQLVSSPVLPATSPFEWERAVRSSLAISIRVKRDPERAMAVVNEVLNAKKAPYFLKEQAQRWKESLIAWKAETPREAGTEEGLYTETVRLIAEAKSLQKYPADRSADVVFLRASASAHDLLSRATKGKRLADGLYLAGLTYEVLQGQNFWDLHQLYFLACIQEAPHTTLARQCFKHYEESVYSGYTGSAGTHIPAAIALKIQELDELSAPTAAQKPN